MNVGDWFKRNGSTILTFLGAGGLVMTVIVGIRATPKAMNACANAQSEKQDGDLSKFEMVKAAAPSYIPTIAIGTGTLICIFGANVLSRKQQAALAGAYAVLESTYREYRHKVQMLCGPETDLAIEKAIKEEQQDREDDRPPWDELQTFYIQGQPQFFERTMEEVLQAEYHLNRNFILKGEVTLNELYEFLDLPITDEGEQLGWNTYDGEAFYGYQWIDFYHRHYQTEDGVNVCSIEIPFGPHMRETQYPKNLFDEVHE